MERICRFSFCVTVNSFGSRACTYGPSLISRFSIFLQFKSLVQQLNFLSVFGSIMYKHTGRADRITVISATNSAVLWFIMKFRGIQFTWSYVNMGAIKQLVDRLVIRLNKKQLELLLRFSYSSSASRRQTTEANLKIIEIMTLATIKDCVPGNAKLYTAGLHSRL